MKILLVTLLAAVAAPAAAQSGPTEAEQKKACYWDAVRLCLTDIPDKAKIEACMTARHEELSTTCRTVFDASLAARAQRQLGNP